MDILITCVLGIATVFIGLLCIVFLVDIMHRIVTKTTNTENAQEIKSATSVADEKITPELIAAVSVAIAEDIGTDAKAIRITKIKKI